MGEFAKAVATLQQKPIWLADVAEPHCPDCGEVPPQFERIGADWYCQTCGHTIPSPKENGPA